MVFGLDPPDPPPTTQTPLLVPPPDKKGTNLLLFSNRHPSAYSSRTKTEVLQSYGAKAEIQTPMLT